MALIFFPSALPVAKIHKIWNMQAVQDVNMFGAMGSEQFHTNNQVSWFNLIL